MSHPVTFSGLWKQIRKLLIIWLVLAIVAAGAVIGLQYRDLPARFQTSAQFTFHFDGMKDEQNLNGDRFELDALREESVIQQAAEKVGVTLKEGGAERIAHAISIESYVPTNVLSQMTKSNAYMTGGGAVEGGAEKLSEYVSTRYTVTFRYGDLKYDTEMGNQLFQAILDAYPEIFAARYGYNKTFMKTMAETDLSGMDFDESVMALDTQLEMLSRFLQPFVTKEQGGYRSAETGLTFPELQGKIDALRTRDLRLLSSTILQKGITSDPAAKEMKKQYLAEQNEIAVQTAKERLNTLNRLIDSYQKIKLIVTSAGGSLFEAKVAQGELSLTTETIEINQESAVYESMLRLRLRLQDELTELQAAAEKIKAQDSSRATDEDQVYAESEMNRMIAETQNLVQQTQRMLEEYDTTVRLNQAYKINNVIKGEDFPLSDLLAAAVPDIIAAEAALVGILILLSALLAGLAGRKKRL